MDLWENAKKQGAFGLGIGIGAGVLAPVVLPILASIAKPVAKGVIKGGLCFYVPRKTDLKSDRGSWGG